MKITKDQEEQIINFGVFGYDAKKISNILGFDINDVKSAMIDKNSDLFKLLEKGRDMSDYVIDIKLFEMTKSGDIKALDKLEHRKRMRN